MSRFLQVYEPTEEGSGKSVAILGSIAGFVSAVLGVFILPFSFKISLIMVLGGIATTKMFGVISNALDAKYERAMGKYLENPSVQNKIIKDCDAIIKRFKKPSDFKSFQFKMNSSEIPELLNAGVDADMQYRNRKIGLKYTSNEYLIRNTYKVLAFGDDTEIRDLTFSFIVELKSGSYKLYLRSLSLDAPIKL